MLECPHSRVRAAAAVALLRLGWGVGLGALSSAALHVLEHMVGVPLRGGVMPPAPDGSALYLDGTGGHVYRGGVGGSGDAAAHRTRLTQQVAESELPAPVPVPVPVPVPLPLPLPLPLTLTLTLAQAQTLSR